MDSLTVDLLHVVLDFLDDWSLVRYHCTTKGRRELLSCEFPTDTFRELSILREKITDHLQLHDPLPRKRVGPAYLHSRQAAQTALDQIQRVKSYILHDLVSHRSPFSRTWSPSDIKRYFWSVPEVKRARWYHGRLWSDSSYNRFTSSGTRHQPRGSICTLTNRLRFQG